MAIEKIGSSHQARETRAAWVREGASVIAGAAVVATVVVVTAVAAESGEWRAIEIERLRR